MAKNYYDLFNISSFATDYEIYIAFSNVIKKIDLTDELIKNNYIDAFIVLSDINLRKKYDISLGLNINEDTEWYYQYTYFGNGMNFFDINGNLFGNKELTKLIEKVKVGSIRSSISKDSFFNERELLDDLAKYTDKRIESKNYISLLSENYIGLSDSEKFNHFKKIYDSYKTGFSFSQEFASLISSRDYNSREIEEATKISAQQLLISKKGVCSNFASLIYEELKGLELESYFLRMILPHWFHHVVLYRVNQDWFICDLTNEYLLGRAGYKNNDENYIGISLGDFIKNNPYVLETCIVPKLAGDISLENDSITLKSFLEYRLNKDLNDFKIKH